MTQAVRTVRPETVRAWVDGWVISRNAPGPVREPWGVRVDVGLPGHLSRHIVPSPTPATLRHLTAVLDAPGTWLKLCAPAEAVERWLPPSWAVQEPEFMMTAELEEAPVTAPPGYTLALTTRAGVTVARLLTQAGEVAARGQLAIAGGTAVVDQVETAGHHRRRGLGTVVMRALAAHAAAGGAGTGVLVATPAGRSLYETLGWCVHTPMTAAVLTV
ncbi:GNAT superfamily N-acetyltransferase [Nonomuraea muscovyensis]|uniref:GNAT superfamily N-acetyltransferase n=1 Tax=Nonomuraea muscovyensis TaxID=1124761 RepID=A0A7X0C1M1_9ACTN|nr:GNAT family N-acetyltransferase [Nonomuraea muscovyensis]MBB6346508.1 GNAT superfamily N-acetyltransferase [Nonomuraea muscovyensis]